MEIDLDAIANNIQRLQKLTDVRVMAVVKANGYGHGLVPVSKKALEAGAAYCGVARVGEALELREAGLEGPVLVLGETPTSCFQKAVQAGVSLTVFAPEQIAELQRVNAGANGKAKVHLKIDTGMSRLGADLEDGFELLQALHQLDGVEVEGLFTHFARADEPQVDVTDRQVALFDELVSEVSSAGLRPPLVHAANSAAALTRPATRYDMVRPGIAIYGMAPSQAVSLPAGFRRALSWKARISQIRTLPPGTGVSYGHAYVTKRKERIGIVPVGYGDGYRREADNEVLIHGRRVPVRGRVCMDQLMVGLDEVPGAAVGDEVVLLGGQGDEIVDASGLARVWDTLNYEVTCGLGARVPRVYH